jgi:hypothetical protein
METFFAVKKNHRYEVRAVYNDNIFDGIIKEIDVQTGKSKLIQPASTSTCEEI